MRSLMLSGSFCLLLCAGCGALSSGAGAPSNPPASGLGPILPLDDAEGLSFTPPFLLADPARNLTHPSALVEGDRLTLFAQSEKSGELTIVTARAETFEAGTGPMEEALRAEASWELGAVGSPAAVRGDEATLLLYIAGGRIGCARLDEGRAIARAPAPVYVDPAGGIVRSIALGRAGDHVRGFALVEGPTGSWVEALEGSFAALVAATAGGAASLLARPLVLPLPAWGLAYVDLGSRLERTPTGRLREDLFFASTLPVLGDLGEMAAPTAIGAASRYLAEGPVDPSMEPAMELVPTPILSGPPVPGSATAVGYRGGVLVLYSARNGPRLAIGVGRHP